MALEEAGILKSVLWRLRSCFLPLGYMPLGEQGWMPLPPAEKGLGTCHALI